MAFSSEFPSVGVWDISYYDDNETDTPVHTERMFVTEHAALPGHYKLMRNKTKHGWNYARGERSEYLMESIKTPWRFNTWMSIIHLTAAKKVD